MDDAKGSVRATRKEWIGLLVLSLPCMIYSMDLTVLNLAIPQLSLALKPSASQLLWIVDIYGFFIAGSLITMGTLGDRIGRRKMLLIGAFVFALASAFAAFSKTPEMLIFTRALQGMAGATLAPSTLSLIRVLFRDPKQRAMAVGLWGTSFSAGGIIGPVVGGALIEHFWWGSVFLINLPIMILLLFVGPRLLPEFKDEAAGQIDIASAALSLVSILLVIFGLKKIAEDGLSSLPFVTIALGLILATLFIRRQKHLTSPLIDLKLFSSPTFDTLILVNAMTMFAFFGTFLFNTQYLQLVLGLSPLTAGLWSLPSSIGMIASSSLSPLLAHKIRPAIIMAIGLCMGVMGYALLASVGGSPHPTRRRRMTPPPTPRPCIHHHVSSTSSLPPLESPCSSLWPHTLAPASPSLR
ncbi:MAG: MFS transporter [Proteobacteria bacterium]|nr:MAG: MFS transporter [Pseudomonadota bacterium]